MIRKTLSWVILPMALATSWAEDPAPMVAVPRLTSPPRLDGRIEAAEWREAAAWTGLVLDGAGPSLAPPSMQAVIRCGFDDQHLFLALHAPNPPGRFPLGRAPRADMPEILEDDHWQIALAMGERSRAGQRGAGYYRISINPLGVVEDRWMLASRADRELLWSFGGEISSKVTSETWDIELAIPWTNLGVERPEGQRVFAQFMLVSGPDARVRRAWAPLLSARPWEAWGELVMRAGPTVQWVDVGGFDEHRLGARFVAVGAPLEVVARVSDKGGNLLHSETARGSDIAVHRRLPGLSSDQNRLAIEVIAGGATVLRACMRVDAWTSEWQARHMSPWRQSGSKQPPAPGAFPEDKPMTLLAFLSAQQKRAQPLDAAFRAAREAGDRDAVAEIGRRCMRELPYLPIGYLIGAFDAAARGRKAEALALLQTAVEKGFNEPELLRQSPEFRDLANDPQFSRILSQAASSPGFTLPGKAVEREIVEPVALADEQNIALHPQWRMPAALFRFAPRPPAGVPVADPNDAIGRLLMGWHQEGSAAGLWGVLYDNRDGGHSRLRAERFPQLTHIRYGDAARRLDLDRQLATAILHEGGVVIGNASLAATAGPFWRSLPRMAHSRPQTMALFYFLYRTNRLYIHPAHLDFPREVSPPAQAPSPARDVFFAQAPFPLVSRGSSGSDQPFLEAVASTLAAFSPSVQRALRERGLLMPTVQRLLRRHYRGVESDEAYLSGTAHPPAFGGDGLRVEAMVRAAHAMTLMDLPPWAELRVVEEERPMPGRDYFEAEGRTEELFTTPAAIARIFRGVARWRRYVLSAAGSSDPNGYPLTFHWRLLQGDPGRVVIRPFGERDTQAEIRIAWHEPFPAASDPTVTTARVDIALFAHNGRTLSAPAFFTVYFPPAEERSYGPDDRIVSVRYHRGDGPRYTDPVIYTPREWTDTYRYDDQGRLVGWKRILSEREEIYDAEGRRATPEGAYRPVIYRLVASAELPRLEPAP